MKRATRRELDSAHPVYRKTMRRVRNTRLSHGENAKRRMWLRPENRSTDGISDDG